MVANSYSTAPTPRTDAAVKAMVDKGVDLTFPAQVALKLARELERELQSRGPNDEQDAARYRFLRSEESEQLNGAWAEIMEAGCNGTKMDAAIDAAMKRIPATNEKEVTK